MNQSAGRRWLRDLHPTARQRGEGNPHQARRSPQVIPHHSRNAKEQGRQSALLLHVPGEPRRTRPPTAAVGGGALRTVLSARPGEALYSAGAEAVAAEAVRPPVGPARLLAAARTALKKQAAEP